MSMWLNSAVVCCLWMWKFLVCFEVLNIFVDIKVFLFCFEVLERVKLWSCLQNFIFYLDWFHSTF